MDNPKLSLSSPIEPAPRPASERHPNSGRDKLAGEAIRELGAIEAEKPKALKWLIKWDQSKKLHPSQDVCVADLAALLVRGSQASSEVREALISEVRAMGWDFRNIHGSEIIEWLESCKSLRMNH